MDESIFHCTAIYLRGAIVVVVVVVVVVCL